MTICNIRFISTMGTTSCSHSRSLEFGHFSNSSINRWLYYCTHYLHTMSKYFELIVNWFLNLLACNFIEREIKRENAQMKPPVLFPFPPTGNRTNQPYLLLLIKYELRLPSEVTPGLLVIQVQIQPLWANSVIKLKSLLFLLQSQKCLLSALILKKCNTPVQ